jgi:hypothetical protein
MSEIFNIGDRVKFKGDAENTPLQETVIAWSNNDARQAIIEHPEGHSGCEIPNRGLHPESLYCFVQFSKIELIERAVTLETVSKQMEKKRPLDPAFFPLSQVLKLIKEKRPTEDHEILTKIINVCEQDEEEKKAIAKAKDAELHKQQMDDIASGKNLQNIKNAEILAPSVAERLSQEEQQRQNIIAILADAEKKGVLIFNGADVYHFDKLIFSETGGFIANAIGLANYFQNVPTEFAEFCKNQMLSVHKNMNEDEFKLSGDEVIELKNDVNDSLSVEKRLEPLTKLKGIGNASINEILKLYDTNEKLDTLADKLRSGESGLGIILAGKLLKFVEDGVKF